MPPPLARARRAPSRHSSRPAQPGSLLVGGARRPPGHRGRDRQLPRPEHDPARPGPAARRRARGTAGRDRPAHRRIPTLDLFRVYTNAAGVAGLLDIRVAPSAEVAADWHDPVDLLFVDGWHSRQGVLADARGFGPHLTDRGIVCFDDYTHYRSVRRGADLACTELGLVRYGTVAAQLWAGRSQVAPAGVVRALRSQRLVSAARGLTRRR